MLIHPPRYDWTGRELAVIDVNTGKLKQVNLFGNDQIGSVDLTWGADSATYNKQYYIKDHLGSIRIAKSSSGSILSARNYFPYGETMQEYQSGTKNKKYRFTGKERDDETNQDYFGARYYDSELGRWNTLDPLKEKYLGISPYNYCVNNPTLLIDPNGRFPIEIHALVIAQVKHEVYGGNSSFYGTAELIHNGMIDLACYQAQSLHFDNLSSYSEVMDLINSGGGFDELDDHTIGDFYSHSNYVDIWNEMQGKGMVSGEMPILEDLNMNSDFGKAVSTLLWTTIWPDNGSEKDHAKRSKDNPKGDSKLYNLAIDGYRRSLRHKYLRKRKTSPIKKLQQQSDDMNAGIQEQWSEYDPSQR